MAEEIESVAAAVAVLVAEVVHSSGGKGYNLFVEEAIAVVRMFVAA